MAFSIRSTFYFGICVNLIVAENGTEFFLISPLSSISMYLLSTGCGIIVDLVVANVKNVDFLFEKNVTSR